MFVSCRFLSLWTPFSSWGTLWPHSPLWVWVAVFRPSPDSDHSFLWVGYTGYNDDDALNLIEWKRKLVRIKQKKATFEFQYFEANIIQYIYKEKKQESTYILLDKDYRYRIIHTFCIQTWWPLNKLEMEKNMICYIYVK